MGEAFQKEFFNLAFRNQKFICSFLAISVTNFSSNVFLFIFEGIFVLSSGSFHRQWKTFRFVDKRNQCRFHWNEKKLFYENLKKIGLMVKRKRKVLEQNTLHLSWVPSIDSRKRTMQRKRGKKFEAESETKASRLKQ